MKALRHLQVVCASGLAFAACVAMAIGAERQSFSVAETTNFRVFTRSTSQSAHQIAAECEQARQQIVHFWLEESDFATWSPKCDIVLHATDGEYLAEVGVQGKATVASTVIDDRRGKIHARRIDIRGTRSDWRQSALPHELTHVVLADRFAGKTLPRWADEGMALLADPGDKQSRHDAELGTALARGQSYRLIELMELRDYPAPHRWGAFYGQGISTVRYLVERDSPQRFLEFLDVAIADGAEAALQKVYGIPSIAACETLWLIERNSGRQAPTPTSGRNGMLAKQERTSGPVND